MSRPGSAGAHLTLRLQRVTSELPPTPDSLAVGPWHVTLDAHDPHGQMVTVIWQPHLVAALLGTLYDRTLSGALERYCAVGDGFAAELEGSFALVILDLKTGRVLALTDRVGTRSLYASPAGDEVYISTEPDLPEFTRRPVCASAVASILVNGFLPSGLTLYGGVRALTPTELHDVRPDRVHSAPYWTVPFNPATPARPAAPHAGELIEVLRGAVSRRLRASGERPHLSLSGGYDSRGLLSLLHGQHPNLTTFSYTLSTIRNGSDAQAAIRLAAQYGVPHRHLLAYRGDVASVVGLNA
ncbi:asparagine synthase-related protein, partial [Deinococcus sp.]|uniref:asparagine synthase-related protein n=1 Tax=Deinococcus sp. TaxID=47478 RepID=UPI002869E00A